MTTRTKKMLVGAALVLILALAAGLWWVYHSLDLLVASAIRKYGPEITGVSIRLDRVKIDPLDGRAALYGLVVGNPEGFHTDYALSLGEIDMTLDPGSLTKNVIVIKQISIVEPAISYEFGPGGSNLKAIQRNVDNYVGQSRNTKTSQSESEPGKKLVIDSLTIKDAKANVSAAALKGRPLSVPIPDLHLRDIGKRSGGATAGEAVKQVLAALTQSVTRAVSSQNLGGVVDTLKKESGSAVDKLRGLFR